MQTSPAAAAAAICTAAFAAGLLAAAPAAPAAVVEPTFDVTIDFEHFPGPDGQLGTDDDVPISAPSNFQDQREQLTDEFAPVGVRFNPIPAESDRNEILERGFANRTAGTGPNLVTTESIAAEFGLVGGEFTRRVRRVSAAIGLGPSSAIGPNVLTIFDRDGNELGSAEATDEVVSLVSPDVDIASFEVRAVRSDRRAAIDDLSFAVVIPEPTSAVAGLGGLALLATRRR